jgi:trehalose/maltose hydrolase-like predicted phosphorylase
MPFRPPSSLAYGAFDAADEGRRETLLTQGNGKLTVRAAACWATADAVHYPGTYHAGFYNRLDDVIQGERMTNESLVNLPNWLPLTFRVLGETEWFALERVEILAYDHRLNTGTGLAERMVLFRDQAGRCTRLLEQRLVSMARPDLAALRLDITPMDWSGQLEIRAAIDGTVSNDRVARFQRFDRQHLHRIEGAGLRPRLAIAERGDAGLWQPHRDRDPPAACWHAAGCRAGGRRCRRADSVRGFRRLYDPAGEDRGHRDVAGP